MSGTASRATLKGAVTAAFVLAASVSGAAAQTQPGWPAQGQGAAPKQQQPSVAPKAQAAPPAAPNRATGGDAQLKQRVEQLEAQLVDLQVVIGTLESLAKSGGGAAAAAAPRGAAPAPVAGYSSSDGGRIDGLETQMQALTAQLEQLAAQVRSMSGGRGGQLGGAASFAARDAAPDGRMTLNDSGGAFRPGAAPGGGFGSTVVTPGGDDQIGRMLNDAGPSQGAGRPSAGAAVAMEAAGSSKQAYETAYGYLLQQNYEAAEGAFDDFLKRYPDDPLAGNAQYWLGETLYVRGQFKQAAGAFLKGYQTYARSTKAPDSLLKLAMSLDRLGQRDAACSSYNELGTRFPNAPSHVRTRADSERKRVGC